MSMNMTQLSIENNKKTNSIESENFNTILNGTSLNDKNLSHNRPNKRKLNHNKAFIKKSKISQESPSNESLDLQPNLPVFQFQPVSIFHSCFKQKTGTPRQFNLIPRSRGYFILPSFHMIDGLEENLYIHIIWLFHENFHIKQYSEIQPNNKLIQNLNVKNVKDEKDIEDIKDIEENQEFIEKDKQMNETNDKQLNNISQEPIFITNQMHRNKIRPPRMDGEKIGVFAARSPYRPNPIGLSICRIHSIQQLKDDSVKISVEGCDLVEGTPIIDIKPYIKEYDAIVDAPLPNWFKNVPLQQHNVSIIQFSDEAMEQLKQLAPKLEFYTNDVSVICNVITEMIQLDPRSKYRREKCSEEVFAFCIDNINVRCIFETSDKCIVCEIESIDKINEMDNKSLKRRNVEDFKRFLKRFKKDET